MKASIRNYKIVYHDPVTAGKLIETLEGKDVEVSIKRIVKHRSDNQNRYYWGVVIPAYQLGFQNHCIGLLSSDLSKEVTDFLLENMYVVPEQAHEALKSEYAQGMYLETGLHKEIRTSKMSTVEYENYLEYCRMFIGAKFGIEIGLPNE